jgi:hypothetical protein
LGEEWPTLKQYIKNESIAHFERFGGFLTTWLFSFMLRPGFCKSEEEYEVLKTFLYAFICSSEGRFSLLSTLQKSK